MNSTIAITSSTAGRTGEDVDLLGRDEQPHREEQGVTGQEREEQPALDEDDRQAEPEQRAPEVLEQPVRDPSSPSRGGGAGDRAAGSPGHPNFRRPRVPSWTSERAPYDPMPHGPAEVGVGPWEGPWPTGEQYDATLLAEGDRRNVVDRYRYWSMEAIVADLDTRRHDFHVAIENWQHDFNIGTIVRTANAFLAAEVHIVGNRRWNRRGAMVTDRYQHVRHHATRRRPGGVPPRAPSAVGWAGAAARHRQPARLAAPRDDGGAAPGLLPVRPGGPGALRAGARRVRRHVLHRAVRLDALDQRQCGRGDRDALLGPAVRRPVRRPEPGAAEHDRPSGRLGHQHRERRTTAGRVPVHHRRRRCPARRRPRRPAGRASRGGPAPCAARRATTGGRRRSATGPRRGSRRRGSRRSCAGSGSPARPGGPGRGGRTRPPRWRPTGAATRSRGWRACGVRRPRPAPSRSRSRAPPGVRAAGGPGGSR